MDSQDSLFRVAVCRRLLSHSDTLLDTFLELDSNGSGSVSRREFKQGLGHKFGEPLVIYDHLPPYVVVSATSMSLVEKYMSHPLFL